MIFDRCFLCLKYRLLEVNKFKLDKSVKILTCHKVGHNTVVNLYLQLNNKIR